jgi:hypothetical protein
MIRPQQTASPGMPKSLQPGHYLSWQQRIYRVTALDPEQPLAIHVETIPGGERVQLALPTLFAAPQKEQDPKQSYEHPSTHHKGAPVLQRVGTIGQGYKLEPLEAAPERTAQVLERHPLVGEADELDRLVAEGPGPSLEPGDRRVSVLDRETRCQATAYLCLQLLWRLLQVRQAHGQRDREPGNAPGDRRCAQDTEQKANPTAPPTTSAPSLQRFAQRT